MKALIALSGGVDSSVSAALMLEKGYELEAVHMKLSDSSSDLGDAERVAKALGIPFRIVDFSDFFESHIIQYFLGSYSSGETPNPCFLCNRLVKFGKLAEYAQEEGFHKIATGHYAGTALHSNGRYSIVQAVDTKKDQSYYMGAVQEQTISLLEFPLANITKKETREIAANFNLPVSQKKDSQEICFVKNDYRDFLRQRKLDLHPGRVLLPNGAVAGNHQGREMFTIGQRRGLGIGGFPEPMYVAGIESQGDIQIAPEPDLWHSTVRLGALHFQKLDPDKRDIDFAFVKIRYNAALQNVKVQFHGENVTLSSEGFWAPAPGQAAVAYDESGAILFSGIIQVYSELSHKLS